MSNEITIMPGTDIALMCWSGPITFRDRKKCVEQVTQFCSKNGINQVIVDTRQQVRKTTTMENYDFGSWLPNETREIKFAIVCHSSDTDVRFVDDVAANRGAQCRSFVTFEEAQRWFNA